MQACIDDVAEIGVGFQCIVKIFDWHYALLDLPKTSFSWSATRLVRSVPTNSPSSRFCFGSGKSGVDPSNSTLTITKTVVSVDMPGESADTLLTCVTLPWVAGKSLLPYPVSSANSRSAAFSGVSPASMRPAGNSTDILLTGACVDTLVRPWRVNLCEQG